MGFPGEFMDWIDLGVHEVAFLPRGLVGSHDGDDSLKGGIRHGQEFPLSLFHRTSVHELENERSMSQSAKRVLK